jgi:hypothetical protein
MKMYMVWRLDGCASLSLKMRRLSTYKQSTSKHLVTFFKTLLKRITIPYSLLEI